MASTLSTDAPAVAATAAASKAAALDIDTIGATFVQHFFGLFDSAERRVNLASLFRAESMLTYIDAKYQGKADIIKHFTAGLNFKTIAHHVLSVDTQPSGCGGLLVLATGHLKIDGGENGLYWSATFHLLPVDDAAQDWWVHNQLFKINYG